MSGSSQSTSPRIVSTQTISTPVGAMLAQWTSRGLYACGFADRSASSRGAAAIAASPYAAPSNNRHHSERPSFDPAHQAELATWQKELAAAFEHYFEHGCFEWDLERLDWSTVTPFRQRVLSCCYAIPPGSTLSYGELAMRANRSTAARAVGTAMATNRWPILIPCHRVVAAGGMGGYSGTGGLTTKQTLLELERRHTNPSEEKEFEPLFHPFYVG
mgnify:CR=1 FL=1